jgi:hypothetical protein
MSFSKEEEGEGGMIGRFFAVKGFRGMGRIHLLSTLSINPDDVVKKGPLPSSIIDKRKLKKWKEKNVSKSRCVG